LLESIQPGQVRKGVVKNITDFGAFIDLDGMDGLLHITDMSWGRIGHPSEMLKQGEEIQVMIIEVNREKERVSLGLKQTTKNPWDEIERKFPVGSKVHGKVVNLVPYGAFVEIEPGVEGLVHITEMSWTKRITKPSELLKVGQELDAVVLGIQKEEQKISPRPPPARAEPMGHGSPQLPDRRPRPRQGPQHDHLRRVHRTRGRHRRHGARLRHELDPQGQPSLRSPQEGRRSGCDRARHRSDAAAHQPRHEAARRRSVDRHRHASSRSATSCRARSAKITSFGAFVELKDGIDGLVHISQISEERIEKIKDVLKPGQVVGARVVKIDRDERRLGLSIKAANY